MIGANRIAPCNSRAFALVITLGLLALLVLAVFALSALVRVNGQISSASVYQVQARQNALMGLSVALGDLQKLAGDDSRITGMAGISGVPGGSGNSEQTTRYWAGVWASDGTFLGWLASGAGVLPNAPPDPVELVGAGSVGASSSTSGNVEKQYVVAGKRPIRVSGLPVSPAAFVTVGNYAFVVIDEGVKVSAYSPGASLALIGVSPLISDGMLPNQLSLKTALVANAANLPKVISYEQLRVVPTPALRPSVLQDTFHYVTLTSLSVSGGQLQSGAININTASTQTWRCILETYNSVPGVTAMSSARITSNGNAIGSGFAAASSGKVANRPFISVADFGASTLLSSNLTNTPVASTISPAQFMAAIGDLFRVRSDTFRVRAYGEAINPSEPGKSEAQVYCEAIVQRTTELAPNGLGRRFIITYFRWLGPDDI